MNKLTEDRHDWLIVSAANDTSSTTAGTHCGTGLSLDPHAFSLLAEFAQVSSVAALRLRAESMHAPCGTTCTGDLDLRFHPPDSLFMPISNHVGAPQTTGHAIA